MSSPRKPSSEPISPPKLIVPKVQAKSEIEAQLEKAREIIDRPIASEEDYDRANADATKWRNVTIALLENIFSNSSKAEAYRERTREVGIGGRLDFREEAKWLRRRMNTRITELESILESLKFISEAPPSAIPTQKTQTTLSRKVFIVHGHDEGTKEAVARFLYQLQLSPVILAEQPNQGQTIIEKFEQSSNDVGFAVVLLTPDDIGTSKSKLEELKPRARQNVIFELGYFAAKLGRRRVCALHKGGIEIPSDYHGVIYVSLDSDDWKWHLARELKQVISIDLNHLS
jgi:predicted nucleotide-binding protein